MVIIQPFVYQKTTAFKERVELANKLNEIIEIFNDVDIESKINEFNNQIEIINGKITQIDNALVEVNNAVQTVEGYNSRLTTVESLSEINQTRLNNLEPRVTDNETLSENNKTRLDSLEPRVTANETDINNIKNRNITFDGIKIFDDGFSGFFTDWKNTLVTNIQIGDIELIAKLIWGNGRYFYFEAVESSNTAIFKCEFGVHIFNNTGAICIFLNKGFGANNPSQNDAYVLAKTVNNEFYLGLRRKVIYGNISIRPTLIMNYGSTDSLSSNMIVWLEEPIVIEGGTSPDYTIVEAQY